jgi:hypothetical protein
MALVIQPWTIGDGAHALVGFEVSDPSRSFATPAQIQAVAATVAKPLDVGGFNGQSELVRGCNPLIMDACGNHGLSTSRLIIRWSWASPA